MATFLKKLETVSVDTLDEMTAGVPSDWRERYPGVRNHILDVRTNLGKFELELQRSLS